MGQDRIEKDDTEQNRLIAEFLEKYEGRIPNPDQYPMRFKFLLKSWLFSKGVLDVHYSEVMK